MNNSVTYIKAIAIVLMVWCHAMRDVTLVSMFHMPLFFFVSGYCFKWQYLDSPTKFISQKLKGVYWPYVKWSIVFLILRIGYKGLVSHCYTYMDVVDRGKRIFFNMSYHEQLLGGFWFLKTLFCASVISYLSIYLSINILKTKNSRILEMMVLCMGLLCFVCCLVLNDDPYFMLPYVEIGPREFLASTFFISGVLFSRLRLQKMPLPYILVSSFVVFVGSFYWDMAMTDMPYESLKLPPYLLTAVLATWALYSLPWERMNEKAAKIFLFIGNNTLTILTWHFLTFKFVSLLIIAIYDLPIERLAEFPVITDYASKGWWIVYFAVAMIVCCIIAYCNRYIKSSWLKL